MSTRTATEESRAGMGLMAWLEDTRVRLPLKGVEARFEVRGEFAAVELDQIYHQTTGRALDCTYTFPLPGDAAVHRCEFHVNGRVIAARVEEVGEARRLFAEKKAEGRRAGMVEAERDNLFTLSLANVQPGDLVVVRLAYVQSLERLGEQRRLRIPFCPGIRYIPGRPLSRPNAGGGTVDDTDQVPDASRLSPPRVDALHPDAAYLDVTGSVDAGEITGLACASHSLATEIQGGLTHARLAAKDALPDQDFLLTWEPVRRDETLVRAWRAERDGWHYALVQLRGPVDPEAARRPAADFYFLVDRSGSMAGAKWSAACRALHAFVGRMRGQDRAHVTLFETSALELTAEPMAAGELAAFRPFLDLEPMGTAGGTNLRPALEQALERVRTCSRGRHATLMVITDGQVGNEEAILAAARKHRNLVIHTVGIDTVVNDAVLEALARRHGGRCVLLRPDEDLTAALGRLGSLTAQPVATRLTAGAGWDSADRLPDLYTGETASVLLRSRTGGELVLAGRDLDGRPVTLAASLAAAGPLVPLLWARRRLNAERDAQPQDERVRLAKEFNLVCPGTAFIAWDEQEKVAVADEGIFQPALEPAGWEAAGGSSDAMVGYVGMVGGASALGPREFRAARASAGQFLKAHACRTIQPRESFGQRLLRLFTGETDRDPLAAITTHPVFQSPAGRNVLTLLKRWLTADPADQDRRLALLEGWLKDHPAPEVGELEASGWLARLLERLRPEIESSPALRAEWRQVEARVARLCGA